MDLPRILRAMMMLSMMLPTTIRMVMMAKRVQSIQPMRPAELSSKRVEGCPHPHDQQAGEDRHQQPEQADEENAQRQGLQDGFAEGGGIDHSVTVGAMQMAGVATVRRRYPL